MAADIQTLLALIAGGGQGVQAIDQRRREQDEQRAREQDRAASRAMQALTQRRELRDLGLRPRTDDDVSEAAGRTLRALPGPSVTPSAVNVPAPQVAKIPGQSPLRTFAESSADDGPSRAMQQLIVNSTFSKKKPIADEANDGPALSAALRPEMITDVYGNQREYVADPSITPEAVTTRLEAAKAAAAEAARVRAEQAKSAETRKQFVDRQRADYNTLKASFPEHALSRGVFDETNPADYNAALADARATSHDVRVATAARDRQTLSPVKISNILSLQQHFNGDKTFQNAGQVAEGYQRVMASAANPTAAGDLSLLYGYNKMLDPGSTVRESEFAAAANAGSLPQRIEAMVGKWKNGRLLENEMRADFVARSKALAIAQRKQLQGTIGRYRKVAERHGIDPDDIVADPFEVIFDVDSGDSPHVQTIDEMLKAGKSEAEIRAALAGGRP